MNLYMSNLSQADLSQADLSNANLIGANLSQANLIKADLSQADLIEADLGNANLMRANLSNANLSGANLSDVNLKEVDLSGAYLSSACLNRVAFKGVYLNGVRVTSPNFFQQLLAQDCKGVEALMERYTIDPTPQYYDWDKDKKYPYYLIQERPSCSPFFYKNPPSIYNQPEKWNFDGLLVYFGVLGSGLVGLWVIWCL